MWSIDEEVLLKVIDESPRHRAEYIRKTLTIEHDLIVEICELFSLELVVNVYIKNVNTDTYNSEKRKKLKRQEIILIKKLQVFKVLIENFENIESRVKNIDYTFTQKFGENYHVDQDWIFTNFILEKRLKTYFDEYNGDR